jgi:hypothetical protein
MNDKRVVRVTAAELSTLQDGTDWNRVDALTDSQIEQAISEDPDAPPILDEGFWSKAIPLDSSRFRSSEPDRAANDHGS